MRSIEAIAVAFPTGIACAKAANGRLEPQTSAAAITMKKPGICFNSTDDCSFDTDNTK
jgi:hypothetical protein